jgi:membrane associated rhomboid family serine protease
VLRPLGTGPLAVIHKGTIAVAVVGFALYAAWEGANFRTNGDAGSALAALAGLAGAVVTALYLRMLLRERRSGA